MPGVMLHEFTHLSIRANDDAYRCAQQARIPGTKTVLDLVPGQGLFTADAYRCWMEDFYVGTSLNRDYLPTFE